MWIWDKIKNGCHWIKENIKKVIWAILGITTITAATIALAPTEIPEEFRLKVPKEEVMEYRIKGDVVYYNYKNGLVELEPNEILEKRTYNTRYYKTDAPNKVSLTIQIGRPFYKEGNTWYYWSLATTTKEYFEKQMGISWIKSAFANVDIQVGAGADDAFERGDGGFNSSYTYLNIHSYADDSNYSYQCGGFRFQDITVPQGATINAETYAEVYVHTTDSDDINCKIYAHDTDNSDDFSDNAHIISESDRPRTTAYASWVQDSIGTGFQGSSIELQSVIQEIIDRPGWALDNNLTLLYIANTDADKTTTILTYDSSSSQGAKLHIEYTAGAAEDIPEDNPTIIIIQ